MLLLDQPVVLNVYQLMLLEVDIPPPINKLVPIVLMLTVTPVLLLIPVLLVLELTMSTVMPVPLVDLHNPEKLVLPVL